MRAKRLRRLPAEEVVAAAVADAESSPWAAAAAAETYAKSYFVLFVLVAAVADADAKRSRTVHDASAHRQVDAAAYTNRIAESACPSYS